MLLHGSGYISRCCCKVECVDPDVVTNLCVKTYNDVSIEQDNFVKLNV